MRPELGTHALLRVAREPVPADAAAMPGWAAAALARAPWVVVRRARGRDGLIPVGVRGHGRAERLAAWLHPDAVLEWLTPAELASRAAWQGSARRASIPALAALDPVAALMRRHGLAWGPCGSVGFELATGLATATADSDLDLMVRADGPLPRALAAELWAELAALPVRADVLLEGPGGAASLEEYARAPRSLVLRTADGARLIDHPWRGAAAAA
ncbi:MAG TPA: malonate decarboxylase holo-ACP synthase [Steroidobacteraceae bacterium]|jgi:phosphoribosyl-dephospho-CoA transferase|nr:malonate decarboxylase holo-ACP synthase [Steroidobacteraceae bacterium]HWX74906.1 malonate decarboxylase holo-ACP synthase [Solirubrobacteraceae bacterium]